MAKISLFIIALGFAFGAQAQEKLYDLNSNPLLYEAWQKVSRQHSVGARAAGDTLDLPFFDDFSEPFSRLRTAADLYPNPDLWIGNTVYINNHMAINPISQGVATFDGLDEQGRAYGFGISQSYQSDSLRSKPINLQGATDTVFLSFFYQAQGLGNAPESEDYLILDFKDTSGAWVQVWQHAGYILEDNKFRRVMLPIMGEEYLYNGFQFRFKNFASRAGSVDHWHIDYIELDEGRTSADTLIKDLAFLGQTSWDNDTIGFQSATASILKEFNSMPWNHYKYIDSLGDALSLMGDTNFFMIRNNADTVLRADYKFNIFNPGGTKVFDDTLSSPLVDPWVVCGNQRNTCNLNINSNFTYWTDNWSFPTDNELTWDSTYFVVKHLMENLEDDYHPNDTSVFKQEFYNYYAYDDGTAELGYGLGELENEGKVAVKYNIKRPESVLRGIQIYLNPVQYDLSNEPVKLVVWSGNEEPGDTMWTSQELNLHYTDQVNYFYHYMLDRELIVSDNIWIGWTQQPATDQKFSIGFDLRADHSDKVYYNLGDYWAQSSIAGSVMIRPVFGQPYTWTGTDEMPEVVSLNVFPNPTTGEVRLQGLNPTQAKNATIQVFDLAGRRVLSQRGYLGSIDMSGLHAGTYLLNILADGRSFTKRVVRQ
ncbi:MAG: T9SS type A sorting domain-containing protein [Flavobacteriales bacterium]|nr:T9SS type A sorting domain-containing protein [Flavobacteriales bacterium]